MTKVKYNPLKKPKWRETGYDYNGRPLCVSLTPHNVLLRLKGTRTSLSLPWGIVLVKAAMVEATMERSRKLAERKAKKRSR